MQSPSPAVARCALPWVTRPEQSPNPVRVSSPRLPDPAPSYATISTSLGLGGRRRQMLQPLSGLAGFLGALPGVGPPPTAPAVQPRANCCNPFGIGGAAGPSRREEIGGRRPEKGGEKGLRDYGLRTAGIVGAPAFCRLSARELVTRTPEIGEWGEGTADCGPRSVSSVFIRFYLWFNSFRAFF